MCNHKNLIIEDNGTSTCVNCSIHFEKKLYVGKFVNKMTHTQSHEMNLRASSQKSSIWVVLEQDYGIVDVSVLKIAEKIFTITTKTKIAKGTNRKSILCASLYYAYYYLKRPTSFKTLLEKFNLTRIHGAKGVRLCQIAMQENNVAWLSDIGRSDRQTPQSCQSNNTRVHSFISTHKEKLQELIFKYGISIKYYDEIEQVIVRIHSIRGKPLTDKINTLWISAIFFWLSLKNPFISAEDFLSINTETQDHISLTKLQTDFSCIKKNLLS